MNNIANKNNLIKKIIVVSEYNEIPKKYLGNIFKINNTLSKIQINESTLIIKSGIGKTNVAIAIAYIFNNYLNCKSIINFGFAGTNDRHFNTNDIILATHIYSNDIDMTAVGIEFGSLNESKSFYKTNLILNSKILGKFLLNKIPIKRGKLVSGDAFINSTEKINKKYHGLKKICFDMESYSLMQSCYNFDFKNTLIIKLISDKINNECNSYDQYKKNSNNIDDVFLSIWKILLAI